jgi:putative ubiquitin-RnfH superfamily antitoxin RatB of RatAB toxin-antitoxin module
MERADNLTVEVAYALPERQVILELSVVPGTTLEQAIRASGILEQFPEIDLTCNKVGVFGKPGRLDTVLHSGDRVEIYRPLIADPKEVRRQRAAQGKVTRKGGGR